MRINQAMVKRLTGMVRALDNEIVWLSNIYTVRYNECVQRDGLFSTKDCPKVLNTLSTKIQAKRRELGRLLDSKHLEDFDIRNLKSIQLGGVYVPR